MPAIVTKESLQSMLDEANQAKRVQIIGRALVIMFNNQTAAEQSANTTDNHNGVGFTGADAHSGCLGAKSFLKHKNLLDWQVDMWMKLSKSGYSRICKYHAQINEAAVKKAEQAQQPLPQ